MSQTEELETLEALTREEADEREHLESFITRSFVDAGLALIKIHDKRLYRSTHRTFDDYLRERWGFVARHGYRIMQAARVVHNLTDATHGSDRAAIVPTNERQVRPITKLPPEDQRAIWADAVQSSNGDGITYAHVEDAKQRHESQKAEPQPAKARLTKKQRLIDAWMECERIFGHKYLAWLKQGRINDDQVLEFAALDSDADKKQIRSLMLQNQTFEQASNTLTGLHPDDPISSLHTRAVQEHGFLAQIGEFLHAVAHGEKGRAELLELLQGW